MLANIEGVIVFGLCLSPTLFHHLLNGRKLRVQREGSVSWLRTNVKPTE